MVARFVIFVLFFHSRVVVGVVQAGRLAIRVVLLCAMQFAYHII